MNTDEKRLRQYLIRSYYFAEAMAFYELYYQPLVATYEPAKRELTTHLKMPSDQYSRKNLRFSRDDKCLDNRYAYNALGLHQISDCRQKMLAPIGTHEACELLD